MRVGDVLMEPLKTEIDAMKAVLMSDLESFVTEREVQERGEEKAEALAQKRMFSQAIKAVDQARGARTTWTVVLRFGTGSVHYAGFGPYATRQQATKALDVLGRTMAPTGYAVVPTRNAAHLEELTTGLDAQPESRGTFGDVRLDAQAFKNGWKGKDATRGKYL